MKRNEIVLGGSAEEYVVSEWRKYENRPMKRHGIDDRVSNGDTNSGSSKGLGDKVCTPWL
jgi:hypothetical protein